jgi:hypothetical protein
MTIRQEMLHAARTGAERLGGRRQSCIEFLASQQNEDGGFRDRLGSSDLYYTVFGVQAFEALGVPLADEQLSSYLAAFGRGEGLDLVHLCCLVRSRVSLPGAGVDDDFRREASERIEGFRAGDGGYALRQGAPRGSVYACFLALGAYQDLGMETPHLRAAVSCVENLRVDEGGYANEAEIPAGSAPATAAAMTVLRHAEAAVSPQTAVWLLNECYRDGGFLAVPAAPQPDLLSTAVSLHALGGFAAPPASIGDDCRRFVHDRQVSKGGFSASTADTTADCEYTYYALLALGNLPA